MSTDQRPSRAAGNPRNRRRVELTPAAYEAVRAHPARFFVVPGHEDLTAGEVVVEQRDRYTLVEKQGAERELVEGRDPRAS